MRQWSINLCNEGEATGTSSTTKQIGIDGVLRKGPILLSILESE